MTSRIVVGIDGSQQSGNALEWAVARAGLGGEQLELVNAYSLTPPSTSTATASRRASPRTG